MSETFRIDREEITIRLMEPADAEEVFACRTHPDVVELQGWFPQNVTEVQELAKLQAGQSPGDPGIQQVVIEWRGEYIGDLGVITEDSGRQTEIGVAVLPEHHGRGFGTIACRMLISELFRRGIHRVTARIDPRNAASRRLLERLDFRQEGHMLKSFWDARRQEWGDELLFALLDEEWPSF